MSTVYIGVSLYFTGTNVLGSNTPLGLTREVLCTTITNNDVVAIAMMYSSHMYL